MDHPRSRIHQVLRRAAYALILIGTGAPANAADSLPSPEDLARQAEVACEELTKREGKEAFEVVMARGALALAFMHQRDRSRATQHAVAAFGEDSGPTLIEDLAAEIDGTVPAISESLDPYAKLLRRRDLVIHLAKHGDFDEACAQAAAFPEHPNKLRFQFDSYYLVAEKQLQQHDEEGVHATIRKLHENIGQVDAEQPFDRCWRVLKIAELAQHLTDLTTARAACAEADKLHIQASKLPRDDFDNIAGWKQRLALVHAVLGNNARASELLDDAEKQFQGHFAGRTDEGAREFFGIAMARAKVAQLQSRNDEALTHLLQAKMWAGRIDDEGLVAFAGKIDESGLVSAFLAFGAGREFSQVVQGQLAAGDEDAALATWSAMPHCLQKLLAQIEMAKYYHAKTRIDAARACADRCQAMLDPRCSAEDTAAISIAVATICREIGDEERMQQTLAKLLSTPSVQSSVSARQIVAGELIDMGLLVEAYRTTLTVDSPADRAVLLARISETAARQGRTNDRSRN
jgi:hypothetical protein